ncbi:dsDNA nuclease domain-containing protein [Luteibacter sp. Lutesp34]|uniref:dsDNA nuclease domain-containing protein n=1 Tax=Luteibacter sp. Lutesp34 TaxID=3243030 RepID=UPI0039B4D95C
MAAIGVGDALDKLLADKPADEKTGAQASKGFGFQHWWGALAVVESLLSGKQDFAVGMEVKEDVVLLDSATSPTEVEFCQVKKNETAGGWSLKDLHRRGRRREDGSRDLSPLAKLYRRRHDFSGHPTRLRFVSNLSVKVAVSDAGTSSVADISLDDLSDNEKGTLRRSLADELGVDESSVDLQDFLLHRTDLPLGQQQTFIAGKLADLCDSGILPYSLSNLSVAARVLASELQTRSNSTDYAKTLSDLRKRLMTRDDALAVMAQIAQAKRPQAREAFDRALERLDQEGHDFMEVKHIRRARVDVLTQAVTRTNQTFRMIAQAMADAESSILSFPATLGGCMGLIVQRARETHPALVAGVSPGILNGICLLVINDGIDIDVLHIAAGAQSEAAQ